MDGAVTLGGFLEHSEVFCYEGMSQLSEKLEQSKGHVNLGWSGSYHYD